MRKMRKEEKEKTDLILSQTRPHIKSDLWSVYTVCIYACVCVPDCRQMAPV